MSYSDRTLRYLSHSRTCLLCFLLVFLSACFQHQYKEAPVDTGDLLNTLHSWTLDAQGVTGFLKANGMSDAVLNSNEFSVERLYLTSLYYDPEMQLAFKKWQKAKLDAEHYQFQLNPKLSIPLEHHSDTSDGVSPWTIGAVLSFIYERKGKREARRAAAEVALLNARLALLQRAHKLYEQVLSTYHDYLLSKTKLDEINKEITVLESLRSQLNENYELGAVSQFELSTVNLELQQRIFESKLEQNISEEYLDKLLAMTQLTHTELGKIQVKYLSPLEMTKALFSGNVHLHHDISELQSELLDTHLDLAEKLNDYALSEAELKLEIENQYPDIVLSPGFIFDQSDNIWALGVSWVLPLFKNTQQNLTILKALEERKIKQQEVLALQKKLLNTLYLSHQSVLRFEKTINVSDEIIGSIEEQADHLLQQIELGGITQVALIRNQIELYKARQNQLAIYDDALDALLEFQHIIHMSHSKLNIPHAVEHWLSTVTENNKQ